MVDPAVPEPAPPRGGFAGVVQWWKRMRERLRQHFAEYGAIALVVYFSIFFATWIGFVIAIRSGVAVEGASGATTIGAGWVATKLTQPLRIVVTIAITPFAAMVWHRVRGRSGVRPDAVAAAAEPVAAVAETDAAKSDAST